MAMASVLIASCSDNRPPSAIPPLEANALENGDSFELFSLEPLAQESDKENQFHGWKVLGKISIDEKTRQRLVAALKKGVAENKGEVAGCFLPRHGIQVKADGKVFAFVICFQCSSAETFVDDSPTKGFLVSKSPATVFNEVLRLAEVPLAKTDR